MDNDPVLRETERELVYLDPLRFFKYHAWTHDPRPGILRLYGLTDPTLPFLLFPFQEEFVRKLISKIEKGEDILAEKSRDMGVSWLIVTAIVWCFIKPISGQDFLLGSRKFELVDKKGAQDSLFEKARFNLYRLHRSLMPQGFNSDKHDNVGFILNPETGSFLKGEANNANFGTGGRYKASIMDEFAKWEETDEQAWTSMGDATPCRIPVSSPWGLGRKFAQLRFSGAVEVLTLHWTLHPLKAAGLYHDEAGKPRSPWYDSECARRRDDPEANIGQELDINYLTSGSPYFDNQLIQKRFEALCKAEPQVTRYNFEQTAAGGIQLLPYEHGKIAILMDPDIHSSFKQYRYLIASDVAEGLEKGDNSVLYVYDRVTGKDVAWFIGRIDTHVLAMLLHHFQTMYDGAFIAVENNNHGHAVVQKLKDLDADQLYEQEFSEAIDKDTARLGWNTNVKTRPIMCADLREALLQGVDGISDVAFFQEAMTFILNEKGKPEAAPGNLDDRVMAQAIKFQLHKWLPAPVRGKVLPSDVGYDDYGKDKRHKKATERPKGPRFV